MAKNDILQGTLVLLVLKTLDATGAMHGYAITTHIQRVSAACCASRRGRSIRRSIAWSSTAGCARPGA
jgi:hypothetical protein